MFIERFIAKLSRPNWARHPDAKTCGVDVTDRIVTDRALA